MFRDIAVGEEVIREAGLRMECGRSNELERVFMESGFRVIAHGVGVFRVLHVGDIDQGCLGIVPPSPSKGRAPGGNRVETRRVVSPSKGRAPGGNRVSVVWPGWFRV